MLSDDIHVPKLYDFAIMDIAGVLLVAIVLAFLTHNCCCCSFKKAFKHYVVILFALAVGVHAMLNIPTTLNYYLCLNDWESILNYRNNYNYVNFSFPECNTLCDWW